MGTASGEIMLISDGEITWSSSNAHLQVVTALHWIAPTLLLSAALDGRLTVLAVQGNSLETVRHSNISVSELPKSMKKSNSSSLKVGIVSITKGSTNEVLVASKVVHQVNSANFLSLADTGAILTIDTESLDSKALGYEIEGIEQLKAHNDKLISINASREAKVLERNGQTSEWLGISNVNSVICRRDGICLLLTDRELLAVKLDPARMLLREPTNLLAIDFDRAGNVVGVELSQKNDIQLHWLQLSDYS